MLFGVNAAHGVTSLEQINRLGEVYGALLDYRPASIPGPRSQGLVEVAAELIPVPAIDNQIGAKIQPVKASPVIGRMRVDWSPVSGLRLGGYLIPPITVLGSKALMLGAQAEYGWGKDNIRSSLRVFTTQGSVSGPFSAPDTTDKFTLSSSGIDLRSGWFTANWALYAGLGKGRNKTQFSLGADGAVIDGSRAYTYAMAGVGWQNGPLLWVVEQQRTFSYLSNIILTVSYGF